MALGVVLVALLAASGCAVGGEDRQPDEKPGKSPTSGLDDAARAACDLFAEYASEGMPVNKRVDRIRAVNNAASESQSGEIEPKGQLLFRVAAQESNESWFLAADSFASECINRGWKP
jgi:hypothetical protein